VVLERTSGLRSGPLVGVVVMDAFTPLYRNWLPLLGPARFLARAAVEARPKSLLWPVGMTLRSFVHFTIGAPWASIPILFTLWLGLPSWVVLAVLAVGVAAHLAVLAVPAAAPMRCWWWTIELHRRWPRVFTGYAGRTDKLQSMTGGEPATSIRYRPICDHPRLSWLALPVRPMVVEYLIGPPPDRALSALLPAVDAIAANIQFVDRVEVDYDADGDSFGVLRVFFRGADHDRPHLTIVEPFPNNSTPPATEREVDQWR